MNFYTNCRVWGGKILYRGIENGIRISRRVNYKPSLFVLSNKPTKHKTLDGRFVERMQFESISEAKQFVDQYKEVDNFPIFGNSNYEYAYIQDLFPSDISYDVTKLRIATIDIEVSSADGFSSTEDVSEPILAITFKVGDSIRVYGCKDFVPPNKNVTYIKCDSESELVHWFLRDWSADYPDIVVGWNTTFYDIPYLVNRITKILGEDVARKLSPWNSFSKRLVKLMGKEQTAFDIVGISSLDYLEMYKKYSPNPNQESYRLDHICNVELGERKLSYSEYGSLQNLYEQNFQKFIEYNIKDVELVDKLDAKMKLIELVLSIAYDAKVNYSDVFTQVRLWDTIIYGHLRGKNLVVPPKQSATKTEKYAGAYVKPPQVGLHDWVVSFDFASLYPNLIVHANISPETVVKEEFIDVKLDKLLSKSYDLSHLKKKNLSLAANGHHFKRDFRGFLPEILLKMMKDRVAYKNKQIEAEKELEEIKSELERRKHGSV